MFPIQISRQITASYQKFSFKLWNIHKTKYQVTWGPFFYSPGFGILIQIFTVQRKKINKSLCNLDVTGLSKNLTNLSYLIFVYFLKIWMYFSLKIRTTTYFFQSKNLFQKLLFVKIKQRGFRLCLTERIFQRAKLSRSETTTDRN